MDGSIQLGLCKSCTIEHAYFFNGSSLKFYLMKEGLNLGGDPSAVFLVPIYTKEKLAGWLGLECLGVVNGQIAFEASELYPADFQVPSGSRILRISESR